MGIGSFEPVVENLPMHINLGDTRSFDSFIGWGTVYRNLEVGGYHIELDLTPEASEKLGDMIELFDLKAIGFAGIKKKEQ
jgi:hypothetical protein